MRREDMWPLLNAAPPPSGRGCCLGWSRAPRVSIAKVTAATLRFIYHNGFCDKTVARAHGRHFRARETWLWVLCSHSTATGAQATGLAYPRPPSPPD